MTCLVILIFIIYGATALRLLIGWNGLLRDEVLFGAASFLLWLLSIINDLHFLRPPYFPSLPCLSWLSWLSCLSCLSWPSLLSYFAFLTPLTLPTLFTNLCILPLLLLLGLLGLVRLLRTWWYGFKPII